jgi:hypothetical protein
MWLDSPDSGRETFSTSEIPANVDSEEMRQQQSRFYTIQVGSRESITGMRAQSFHASYENFDRLNFEASCDSLYSTCMERLRPHPRHLIRANQLALCKRCLKIYKLFSYEWERADENVVHGAVRIQCYLFGILVHTAAACLRSIYTNGLPSKFPMLPSS